MWRLVIIFLKNIEQNQYWKSESFATGYNLLTLDKLKIVDPESRPNGNAMYPVVMVINMGLKVGF